MLNIFNKKETEDTVDSGNSTPLPKPTPVASYEGTPDELSGREFFFAVWYAKHRVLLRSIGLGFFVVIDLFLLMSGLVGLGNYLIFGIDEDNKLQNELSIFPDYQAWAPAYTAADLTLSGARVLPGGVNRYDVYAEAINPNEHFYASFEYYFIIDGEPTAHTRSVLLAGEKRPLVYFGIASNNFPRTAGVVIENLNWRRISPHLAPDPLAFQNERLNFKVDKFNFTPASASADAGVIIFNLLNNSAFSYLDLSAVVGLYQGDSLVGLKPLELYGFVSGQTATVDLRTFVNALYVTGVKVFPIVNVFDESVYLPPAS